MHSEYIKTMSGISTLGRAGMLAGPHHYAELIARGIAVVTEGGGKESATIKEWADSILYLFMAMPLDSRMRSQAFKLMDENPDSIGYYLDIAGGRMPWHHRLRIVRNDQTYGPKLYRVLRCEHTLEDERKARGADKQDSSPTSA